MAEEKKTSKAGRQMERKALELERKIVRFTNIDSESFTHSFRGVSITVKAGENYMGRLPECDHLATHLARKMLAREKKKTLQKHQGVQLWNEQEISELKAKIISPVGEEEAPEVLSAKDAREADQKRIEAEFGEPKEKPKVKAPVVVTKKDLIKDLESRGIKVDASLSKEQLQQKVMDAEAAGIVPKEDGEEEPEESKK